MFGIRRAVCEVLGRGVRSGPGLVSGGRQLVQRRSWGGEQGVPAAAGPSLIQVVRLRTYAKVKPRPEETKSHLDDLPPSMLKQEYEGVKNIEGVNDVVKRLLSLDMASQSDKLKIKIQQLVAKVKKSPDEGGSKAVQIAVFTAKIQNFKEHIQKHSKDMANKRKMMMMIDRRKKLLKSLRLTDYDRFQHVCNQLDIVYTFPPEYYRRATRRWQAKKALCLKVHEEVMKLKAAGLLPKKKRQYQNKSTPAQP